MLLPCLILFAANQVAQYYHIGNWLTTGYLDDLLLFPIALSIATLFLPRPPGRNAILVGLAAMSLLFEVIMPLFNTRFTPDPIDVICYAIGAAFWMFYEIKFG